MNSKAIQKFEPTMVLEICLAYPYIPRTFSNSRYCPRNPKVIHPTNQQKLFHHSISQLLLTPAALLPLPPRWQTCNLSIEWLAGSFQKLREEQRAIQEMSLLPQCSLIVFHLFWMCWRAAHWFILCLILWPQSCLHCSGNICNVAI